MILSQFAISKLQSVISRTRCRARPGSSHFRTHFAATNSTNPESNSKVGYPRNHKTAGWMIARKFLGVLCGSSKDGDEKERSVSPAKRARDSPQRSRTPDTRGAVSFSSSNNEKDPDFAGYYSLKNSHANTPATSAATSVSCPLSLFTIPTSRAAVLSHEDSMLLKYFICLHRSQQDPLLYFKWGFWAMGDPKKAQGGRLEIEDIIETEVQLATTNKQIRRSPPGEVAYLRLGLHPNRRCGKIAFQVNLIQAADFFEKTATLVVCEQISMPGALHIPVIGVDLNESPRDYALVKLWLGPKLATEKSLLGQISDLLSRLVLLSSSEFDTAFRTAVYIHESGHTVTLKK